MTDNTALNQAPQNVALQYIEQLEIMVTFQVGAESNSEAVDLAKLYHEETKDEETKLGWHAFINELQCGGNFAQAMGATGFFSKDVQRILTILGEIGPATAAAVVYLSALAHRK